mmetsp:Transcript_12242/g.21825  ORF Transcript_12242/g.21825 Transcript_12242/m.21825 type:complete len:402 (-) Transcript_12242:1074-2279(-)
MLHRKPPLKIIRMNGKLLQSIVKRFGRLGQLSHHLILIQVQLLQILKLVVFHGKRSGELITRGAKVFEELGLGEGGGERTIEFVAGDFQVFDEVIFVPAVRKVAVQAIVVHIEDSQRLEIANLIGNRPHKIISLRIQPLQILQRCKDIRKCPIKQIPIDEYGTQHIVIFKRIGETTVQEIATQEHGVQFFPRPADTFGDGPSEVILLDFEPADFGEGVYFTWNLTVEVIRSAHTNPTNLIIISHKITPLNTPPRTPITRTLNPKPFTLALLPQPSLILLPIIPIHGIIKQRHDIPLFESGIIKVQPRPTRPKVRNEITIRHPHGRLILRRALHLQRIPAQRFQLLDNLRKPHRRGHARRDIAGHQTRERRGILGDLRDTRFLPSLGVLQGDGDGHRDDDHD